MIYIPIEIHLRMIREDLEAIKSCIPSYHIPRSCIAICHACNFAQSMGLGFNTCPTHAPEFSMIPIDFPLEES